MELGNLKLFPWQEREELIASSIKNFLRSSNAENVYVAEIDPSFSDTENFCKEYNVPLDATVNCIILEAKRADKKWLASCAIQGAERADVNTVIRKTLEARKVSFAQKEKAVEESRMEFGAISPLGLPASWAVIVNEVILNNEYVLIGSGFRNSKLIIPSNLLKKIPSVQILDITKQV